MHLSSNITQLDPQKKALRDVDGDEYTYDKLLLATGGYPIHLPYGGDNIIYFRDFQDYKHLRALSERGDLFLVIGGGFIGSEIAAALTIVGKKVIMIFPEAGIGANVYPGEISHYLIDYFRNKGVEVLPGELAANVERNGDRITVQTKSGRIFEVDGVVAGIGIRPNLELAQQAGLQIENGIVVDEKLRSSIGEIFAAGDVANFFHSTLKKRVRIEHEDNALQMGKQAGRNMAGADEAYTHVPMFYSDLFDIGYEAVGEISSKLEIVIDWQDAFKKGVIYYLGDGSVRGVLLWNVWDTVPAARALLAEPGPFKPEDLIGRLS